MNNLVVFLMTIRGLYLQATRWLVKHQVAVERVFVPLIAITVSAYGSCLIIQELQKALEFEGGKYVDSPVWAAVTILLSIFFIGTVKIIYIYWLRPLDICLARALQVHIIRPLRRFEKWAQRVSTQE